MAAVAAAGQVIDRRPHSALSLARYVGILVGMIANTCIEATGRFAMELGYHVTLVTDATAAFSPEAMHAAHAINGPTYAHAITTTDALTAELTGGRRHEDHGKAA